MSNQTADQTDAALILDGIARAIEAFPEGALDRTQQQDRAELLATLRRVAESVWPDSGGQDFKTGAAYASNEYRNAILLSMLSTDAVKDILTK